MEAREKLALCVSEACPGPVREDCAQRLADVDAAMPSLVFSVKDDRGGDVTGAVRLTIDRQPGVPLEGTPVQVDPGEHRLTFEGADGSARAEMTVVVREGEKARRVDVVLPAQPRPVPSAHTSPLEPSRHGSAAAATLGTSELAILGLGGVGLVGITVGVVEALAANATHDSLEGLCKPTCPPPAQRDLDAFHGERAASAVGYVVGVLAIAGGVTVWLLAPTETRKVGAWIGPNSAGVAGHF